MGDMVPDDEPPEFTRFSLADAFTSVRADVRPAVANALWGPLRANDGEGQWQVPRRRVTPASGGGGLYVTTPPVPPPDARFQWEIVKSEVVMFAFAGRVESRLGRGFTARLFQTDHDRLLQMVDARHRAEYEQAVKRAVCERPFYRAPELPTGWRRNHKEPLLTERAASVLQQLASLAVVEFITPEREDALLDDAS